MIIPLYRMATRVIESIQTEAEAEADTSQIARIFDTRNEMLQHYCSIINKPKLLEIVVFRGEFLDYIVKNCSIRSIDAVDLFNCITCSGNVDGNYVVKYDVGQSFKELYDKYKDVENVRLFKSDSSSYLNTQPDNMYDIVYLDGDHSYEGVKRDLISAFSKVKNGGYIMGHDYEMNMKKALHSYDFGVKRAVDEFCTTHKQCILAKAVDGCVSFCIKLNKD